MNINKIMEQRNEFKKRQLTILNSTDNEVSYMLSGNFCIIYNDEKNFDVIFETGEEYHFCLNNDMYYIVNDLTDNTDNITQKWYVKCEE